MRKHLFALTLLLMCLSLVASAHRLNEYLQAVTISLNKDSVELHLHLTAGSDVAQQVVKAIDLNGNGILSEEEQQTYSRLILQGLTVTLDGYPAHLQLAAWFYPAVGVIAKGMGDIQLYVTAGSMSVKAVHRLTIAHTSPQPMAVYMVNCLLPADTSIHVVDQHRNTDQSLYSLDFTTGDSLPLASADQQLVIDKADHYATVQTYVFNGIRHILGGYDHLLFICALVLGAAGLWDLIKIITAFTIAHSLTLTLAALRLLHLPQEIVEPLIAASILFVALQNVFWPKAASGNSRLLVAFLFGLFHGLGFAGGLLELMHAMPANLFLYAIVGFSLGVEAGNQLVLLPLYGLLQLLKQARTHAENPHRLLAWQRFASGIVAAGGLYYLLVALFQEF